MFPESAVVSATNPRAKHWSRGKGLPAEVGGAGGTKAGAGGARRARAGAGGAGGAKAGAGGAGRARATMEARILVRMVAG